MTERRYNDAEVAAIFKRAAETQQAGQRLVPLSEGMTLAQLQDIGKEVGLAPELVSDAARSIDALGRPTSLRFLGLTIGVGRTIDLGRRLSQEEWEQFVVDLRDTFDARGKLASEGGFRQWTNGNLQALLEPTATGHRIRLRTMKGNAVSLLVAGVGTIGFSAVMFLAATFLGGGGGALSAWGTAAAAGATMFALGALRVLPWARLRRKQMEDIAARIAAAGPRSETDPQSAR